ncbi:glycosyltransferase family 39 protein [Lichenicoccus sp.]|uniref:glycosyltransferase family 39 protein n=1 Tax=Lichenicoccus sp. TaxID=2781899 RepID=UPI003D0A4D71
MVALVLVALLARLYHLGDKPYWLDEVTTVRRASLGVHALVVDSLSFHHLPLYFLISRGFTALGTNEASLRLPAALFGALSCALLYGASRMIGGRRAAVAASMLLALNPFQVQYGQEARSYTLVICFIVLALWSLASTLRNPAAAARPWRAPGSARIGWLLYGVATIGALDTLSVAVYWLLAGLLAIALIAAKHPKQRRGLLINAGLVHVVILACYLPWVVAMHQLTHGDMASGLDWVPPLTWYRFWTTIQGVYLLRTTSLIRFYTFPDGLPWLGWLASLAAGLGLLRNVGRDGAVLVAAVALAMLPAGLLVTSLVSPVWMPRYLAWSGPVFFLFAGLGLARLPRRSSWVAIAALGALSVVNLLPYYRLETKPLWNQAAVLLRRGLPPEGLLFTDAPVDVAMMNITLGRLGEPFRADRWTADPGLALRQLQGGHPVWAVHGRVGQADHTSVATFAETVSPLGAPCWSGAVGLDIIIEAFAPSGSACTAPAVE